MKQVSLSLLAALMLAAPAGAQVASPSPGAEASPVPSPSPSYAPAVVRIGTTAVLSLREPVGDITPEERANVVQSRINNVLLNHPYLTWADVKVLREGVTPVIYWGRFPIVSVDAGHARLNNYSSPDILAHAWANNLRQAAKTFFAAKVMPDRALYRNARGSDFVYRRTEVTFND